MHGIVDLMNIAAELTSKMGYVPVQQNKMNGNVAKYKKIAFGSFDIIVRITMEHLVGAFPLLSESTLPRQRLFFIGL